ncbi:MAG: NADP-dependent methylenetetrahydromethanopterin/methylenetetrahydrofolate dehydrogenase [Fimbriiglobus sp.]
MHSILVQLDTDPLPSVFDRVVAVDAGAQHIFSYGGVTPQNVMSLVHGCIFTRGPKDLKQTAIFIGGSDVDAGDALLTEVKKHLIPAYGLSVSLMLDSNGANTTAAAAVYAASKHLELPKTSALVLGGTGPVGRRVAHLLAMLGARVAIGSRQVERAEVVARHLRTLFPQARIEAVAVSSSADAPKALDGRQLVFAAGAPGIVLLPKKVRDTSKSLKVAIDLNGVPPTGIEGIDLMDKATDREGVVCYGALGVGGTKMKLHKAALRELFTANNLVLDIESIYPLAATLA